MRINNSIHNVVEGLLEETEERSKIEFELNYWENSAKITWKEDVGFFSFGSGFNTEFINIEIFITSESKDES